jgi:hypothetical protein
MTTPRRRGADTKPRKPRGKKTGGRVAAIPGEPRNQVITARVSEVVKLWYQSQPGDMIEKWARGLFEGE